MAKSKTKAKTSKGQASAKKPAAKAPARSAKPQTKSKAKAASSGAKSKAQAPASADIRHTYKESLLGKIANKQRGAPAAKPKK